MNPIPKYLPEAYRKMGAQALHFAVIPLFFLLFVFFYRPFDVENLLSMGSNVTYVFHTCIITSIIFGVLLISRMILFALRKAEITLGWYFFWCFMELLAMSLGTALYVWLFSHGKIFFDIFFNVLLYQGSIVVFPYLICYLFLKISSLSSTKAVPDAISDERIKFYDNNGKLKLLVSATSILYIAADENYVQIHYEEGESLKSFSLRASMQSIEELCACHGIVRCHRSYYINTARLKVLRKGKENMIIAELDNPMASSIPVSKRYYDGLSQLL